MNQFKMFPNLKSIIDGGPMEGHDRRTRGSRKKAHKRVKLECTEEEISNQWEQFKSKHVDIFENRGSDKYGDRDPNYVIDLYLKPHLTNIKQILLDEDVSLGG